jgi:DHA1 family multidrug resistance protein-like MFS transporter
LEAGGTKAEASTQVGLLTGIFALMQFFFAFLWGKCSDHFGRKPVFLIGLIGYSVSMMFFAIGTNLTMLYTARIAGGVLSAKVLPVAGAFVSDVTSEKARSHGMTWLGSATGLGVVLGPVMGAFISQTDFHFTYQFYHFKLTVFRFHFLQPLCFLCYLLWRL